MFLSQLEKLQKNIVERDGKYAFGRLVGHNSVKWSEKYHEFIA
jgi:hypothetical protein